MGEDVEREGLRKTPLRVAKSLLALTSGYGGSPAAVVGDALFTVDARELVLVRDIDVFSLCEHHMLPFFGRAHVGYLPAGRVVGLSKLARLVDLFAKRLQVQERLTQQIADAVQEATGARGVAVVIEATCVRARRAAGGSSGARDGAGGAGRRAFPLRPPRGPRGATRPPPRPLTPSPPARLPVHLPSRARAQAHVHVHARRVQVGRHDAVGGLHGRVPRRARRARAQGRDARGRQGRRRRGRGALEAARAGGASPGGGRGVDVVS